mgnify:CR=1 FL=1
MNKILITSGCSFSTVGKNRRNIITWPTHLFDILNNHGYDKHVSSAMPSQGNGLISRSIFYEITEALKIYKPEDILVGVMWSHSNRFDYRCEDPSLLSWSKYFNKDANNESSDVMSKESSINPRSFVKNASRNWVIGNIHLPAEEITTYLKYYYSEIGSSILSLEHILRLQYFLQLKKIPYFFTDYIDNNIVGNNKEDIELQYLLSEVNRDNYLPITSMAGWVTNNSDTKEAYIASNLNPNHAAHPITEQHKEFTDKIIYPWLTQKNYI